MRQLTEMAMNPWDFTLYSTGDGSRIMKIIINDVEYKVDVEHYFLVGKSEDEISESLDDFKLLANNIRAADPNVVYPEVKKPN